MTDNEPEDYYELYVDALVLDDDFGQISVPIEPLPGEDPSDTMIRWLIEEGIFIPGPDSFQVDTEKAEAYDPNLAKLLRAMLQAEADTVLNQLEREGLLYSTVNEEGEMVYGLTDAGKEYQEAIRDFLAE